MLTASHPSFPSRLRSAENLFTLDVAARSLVYSLAVKTLYSHRTDSRASMGTMTTRGHTTRGYPIG